MRPRPQHGGPMKTTPVFLLVASVLTACAGATKPDVPDTEIQRKVLTLTRLRTV
jgi:hypothetical protein